MAAIALDLSPVVATLVERPFDRATLDKASAAVDGHPQAYATALRCAAKRVEDKLAAAYFFTEAARVHESVDDIGGAIALLFRARECDPDHPGTRESLAACLTRLALRSGLSFTFTAPSANASQADQSAADAAPDTARPIPRQSGLRPPSPERPRDTLPDLFGLDGEASSRLTQEAVEWADFGDSRALVPAAPEAPRKPDSDPVVFPLKGARRVEPLLPPEDPEMNVRTLVPARPAEEPVLRAVADIAMPTRRSSELPPTAEPRPSSPPPPVRLTPVDGEGAPRTSSPPPSRRLERPVAAAPQEPSATANADATLPPSPSLTDAYGEEGAPRTERPAGDLLVGAVFEALHGLHFLDDARSGAEFVAKVLHDSTRASTVLVHVYDINSRHFVVTSAIGPRAAALTDYATPDDDPFVAELMKEQEALLVLDPKDDPRIARGRFLLVEPERSLVCAPAVLEGRYLGLLELVDPVDGSEFTEDDRNVLTYAASSLARFLDRRGIVLSEDDEPTPEATSATA